MSLTRDQLRAARMLLHLRQDELATMSGVAVATIRRFETGNAIRPAQAAILRGSLETAGAVFLSEGEPPSVPTGMGVALRLELPESTQARIAAEEAKEAGRLATDRLRREAHRADPRNDRPRGRPRAKNKEEVGAASARAEAEAAGAEAEGTDPTHDS